MKYLIIFVLFLVACSDVTIEKCRPFEVTISDALPIQFWPIDCDTYNEKEVCGVHPKCWCHPWQCGDEITTQFTDTDSDAEFSLGVYNENGSLLESIPFDKTNQFSTDTDLSYSEEFISSLGIFSQNGNIGTEAQWNWIGGAIQADGSSGTKAASFDLYTERSAGVGGYSKWPPGTYMFRLVISNNSSGGSSPLEESLTIRGADSFSDPIYESVFTTIGRGTSNQTYDVTLHLTAEVNYILFSFDKIGPSTGSAINIVVSSISLITYPLDYSRSVHYNSFVPETYSICDERIQLKITDSSTGGTDVAKSDCLDVRNTHDCTGLIEYSNNRSFAGLVYENVTPALSPKIRVPFILFHERFPEEDNVIELNSSIEKTSGTLRAQRLLETDYIPYYMHRKIMLILKHQTVLIDNQYWTKQEAYEIQDGERRWPVKKAKCFLTEKDYVQRAIL